MADSFTIHPLAERFPQMPTKDFEDLKESIRKYGVFEPIIINAKNQVLDGRHRYRALIDLKMSPFSQTASFEETVKGSKDLSEEQFIYDSNIHRRHLTDDQRVMLAAEFAPFFRKEGADKKEEVTDNLIPGGKVKSSMNLKRDSSKKRNTKQMNANSTVGKIAAKAGVSRRKASQSITVLADPELTRQVQSGEKPLREAAKEVKARNPKPAKLPKATPPTTLTYEQVAKAWGLFLKRYSTDKQKEVERIVLDILLSTTEQEPYACTN